MHLSLRRPKIRTHEGIFHAAIPTKELTINYEVTTQAFRDVPKLPHAIQVPELAHVLENGQVQNTMMTVFNLFELTSKLRDGIVQTSRPTLVASDTPGLDEIQQRKELYAWLHEWLHKVLSKVVGSQTWVSAFVQSWTPPAEKDIQQDKPLFSVGKYVWNVPETVWNATQFGTVCAVIMLTVSALHFQHEKFQFTSEQGRFYGRILMNFVVFLVSNARIVPTLNE